MGSRGFPGCLALFEASLGPSSMKRIYIFALVCVAGVVSAQTTSTSSSAAATPQSVHDGGSDNAILGTSAGDLNRTFTDQDGNSFTTRDLANRLADLERDIQATLPLLAAFNNNPGFLTANPNNTLSNNAISFPQARLLAARNLGTNVASNLGANFAQPPVSAGSTTLPPTDIGNSAGLRSGFTAPGSWTDASKDLVVLQNDLERVLPLLNVFNNLTNSFGITGSSVGGSSGFGTGTSSGGGWRIPSPPRVPGVQSPR